MNDKKYLISAMKLILLNYFMLIWGITASAQDKIGRASCRERV